MRPDGRLDADLYTLLRPLVSLPGDAGQLARALLVVTNPSPTREDLAGVEALSAAYKASAGAWLGEALAARAEGDEARHFEALAARDRAKATSEVLVVLARAVRG